MGSDEVLTLQLTSAGASLATVVLGRKVLVLYGHGDLESWIPHPLRGQSYGAPVLTHIILAWLMLIWMNAYLDEADEIVVVTACFSSF